MTDFESARKNMLEGQVRTNDVSDKKLQVVMLDLPRERFVPKAKQSLAYSDNTIEIADGRYLMRPRAFAKLMQGARVTPGAVSLVIGCATGYAAAVMGKLTEAVIALESDEDLAAKATKTLGELEIDNVAVVTGSLAGGLATQGPYDIIFVDGALARRCPQIEGQLAEGGRMAVIIQNGKVGRATIITRNKDNFVAVELFDASAPLLPGFEQESEFVF